ncbi:related to quinic acid utilisation protein QUTG (inositol-1(or 4)-monophosphatase) [Sporisorium reilianum SRZ2]|uniref:Inositol-1-monophosphatase n=1 Tax=Sporisorium reilianum (strain SRZ2) TaxID=999809 RepID=E7A0Y8_SPORE|nr:related to quinic acid utilisation protein QUTG (inositol-1(or 4)-monophosphatase) [Sporisorium reilianum SRZ2]
MSSTLSDSDLQEIYTFAIDLARKAGRAIVDGSSRRFSSSAGFDQKKNTADLVTETDQAVEELVKRDIAARFPGHTFIGEESWASGEENAVGTGVTWIVDPIDGTTNFVHGFPYTCISIGVVAGRQAVVGVVYAPFMDTLYQGCVGRGSFVSSPQHPVPARLPLATPAPLPALNQALVAFEWGADRRAAVLQKKLASFAKITGDAQGGVDGGKFAQGVRSVGSAALNFCCVATGTLDLYWEIGCWAWDVCAGIVIAQEAGAAVVGSKAHALDVIEAQDGFNVVTPDLLTGRKYVVVRNIDAQDEAKNRDAQRHILREFYSCIDEWDP